ncbi:hypothetical protein QBC32DRAFT_373373 [Pseudoneurospora amorphoporcata]|uniref:Uncharacterized protein n=1 Tax=Pseudoneurospora amorphoporcata TaxID=241081 RepID=A0AAN6SCL2_9PEZI|nr:hypothetical protein QBC32DRAFT_373373 [Pseudoneurospora amorphoporcata]
MLHLFHSVPRFGFDGGERTVNPFAGRCTGRRLPPGPDGPPRRDPLTNPAFLWVYQAGDLGTNRKPKLHVSISYTVRLEGTFDPGAKVYTYAISPIEDHLLLACETQDSTVGGSAGTNLAVARSPVHDHIVASGSADDAVHICGVRRSNALIGLSNQEDSLGVLHPSSMAGSGHVERASFQDFRDLGICASAKAHNEPVNGLTWTLCLQVTIAKFVSGHATTGTNTLASFAHSSEMIYRRRLTMFVSPIGLTPQKKRLLFYLNGTEILVMNLHEGTITTRLRGMGPAMAAIRAQRGKQTIRNLLRSIPAASSWEEPMPRGGIYSGRLRSWARQLEGS